MMRTSALMGVQAVMIAAVLLLLPLLLLQLLLLLLHVKIQVLTMHVQLEMQVVVRLERRNAIALLKTMRNQFRASAKAATNTHNTCSFAKAASGRCTVLENAKSMIGSEETRRTKLTAPSSKGRLP